jgi:hypothetical protein
VRGLLIGLAVVLFGAALVIAWLPPTPEGPLEFDGPGVRRALHLAAGNPCDGSIAAAFETRAADGSDPYHTESCRDPARRQLAVSGLLLLAGVGVLVVGGRQRADASPNMTAA